MRIIIAPDSFKGSLSAQTICTVLKRKINTLMPKADVLCMPLGDGGEGTARVYYALHRGAKKQEVTVSDLYSREKIVEYPLIGDNAYIETAVAVGLDESRLDVMHASSLGVGQMIADAQARGCKKIYLGLGGSGTCDGGMGALTALGARFFAENGKPLFPSGQSLEKIRIAKYLPTCCDIQFTAVCDVSSPLYGSRGSAMVFAPQKGADEEQVEMLDRGLYNLALKTGKLNFADRYGAGAAGGLGFFAQAFLGARAVSGIDFVLDMYGFDSTEADLIITGEGCVDGQTLEGKAVSGVLRRSRGRPVLVLCGKRGDGAERLSAPVACISPDGESPEASIKNALKNLEGFDIIKYMRCAL